MDELAAVGDLADLEFRVGPAAAARVLRPAGFFDADEGQIEVATGRHGGAVDHPRDCGIRPLEGVEAQFGLGVGVLQRVDQFDRCVVRRAPGAQQGNHLGLFGVVVRWLWQGLAAGTQQVVDEGQPVAGGDGPDLVTAVGIEGGKGGLRWLLAVQVESHLLALVADDQFPAAELAGQDDDQGREHARGLLGVAMRDEEVLGPVDQELVECGLHPAADPQLRGDPRYHPGQVRVPAPAREVHPGRIDLPGAAHPGIAQGLGAPAVGGLLGHRGDLLRLHRQQRERDRTHPLDLQPRGVDVEGAGGIEVARALDLVQDRGEVAGEFRHDRP